jgi:hypothetical protein
VAREALVGENRSDVRVEAHLLRQGGGGLRDGKGGK